MLLSINREHQVPETTIPFFAQCRLFAPLPPTGMLTLRQPRPLPLNFYAKWIKIGASLLNGCDERAGFSSICITGDPTGRLAIPKGAHQRCPLNWMNKVRNHAFW